MQPVIELCSQYRLPNLLAVSTPFTDAFNPHWEQVSAESKAWVLGYDILSDKRRAVFLHGKIERLCAHAWPYAAREQFRTCCDFVNLLFAIDEITDLQDKEGARTTASRFVKALEDENWNDDSKVSRMTKDLRHRMIATGISPLNLRRFVEASTKYIEAVVDEAAFRGENEVLAQENYQAHRRESSGVPLCFVMIAYCLHIDLPNYVYEHQAFKRVFNIGVDMVSWANDLYSYNVEQSRGIEGSNIITVMIRTHGYTLQQASNHVGDCYKKFMDDFVAGMASLPSFGTEIDKVITLYFNKMSHWCIGNLVWSFETPRYFGAKVDEVKKTGVVTLLPSEEK